MAQRLILIDDLDETEGAETITYGVNGQDYEIDLSEVNAQRSYDVLGPYIEKSRRAWAEANGHEVSGRGRIKKDVIDAYDQAHS